MLKTLENPEKNSSQKSEAEKKFSCRGEEKDWKENLFVLI